MGGLPPVPHTQSPRRGPPGAAAVPWDSPAQSNQRSSLVVAQPILLCSTLNPPPTPTGSELIASLYAYRSIARALPTVSGSEANKKAIYASSFEAR